MLAYSYQSEIVKAYQRLLNLDACEIERLKKEIKQLKLELIECRSPYCHNKCEFCKGTGWVKRLDILNVLNKE